MSPVFSVEQHNVAKRLWKQGVPLVWSFKSGHVVQRASSIGIPMPDFLPSEPCVLLCHLTILLVDLTRFVAFISTEIQKRARFLRSAQGTVPPLALVVPTLRLSDCRCVHDLQYRLGKIGRH